MKILGISAYYHDSAASISIHGKIIAAAQEERYTRIKNDPSFPSHAIWYCLEKADVTLEELDAIAFYDKPFLKFERLIENYYANAPKGFLSFITAVPVWLRKKLFLKDIIRRELKDINNGKKTTVKLLFPEHHLSHAASAFFPSPFESAAIVTLDGMGEWCTAGIYSGKGNQIEVFKELHYPHSIGLLYSSFTYFLGFKVNSGEYKLMGLAPYGNSKDIPPYINIIKNELVEVYEDGSIWLAPEYFSYTTTLKMIPIPKWESLFNIKKRNPEENIEQQHCNIALAIQKVTEEIILKIAAHAKAITKSEYLCLAGGVALNCVANGKLMQSDLFKEIYIQPAAGDAGGAIGAALAAHYIYFNKKRNNEVEDIMPNAYLGDDFDNESIKNYLHKKNAKYHLYNEETLVEKTVELLLEKNIIGWFQGRMEFGPRALGMRSILADARTPEMQKKINLNIKYRESFRPFAPIVLEEDAFKLFDLSQTSPYMGIVTALKEKYLNPIPKTFEKYTLAEKQAHQQSDFPAITHVDGSARIQTVSKNPDTRIRKLLEQFKAASGTGILVNTSFNVRGEPIVRTPKDAYTCFMATEMDALVIGNFILLKEEQPEQNRIHRKTFNPD